MNGAAWRSCERHRKGGPGPEAAASLVGLSKRLRCAFRHTARLYPVARTFDLPADEPVDSVLIGERGDLLIARRLIWLLSLAARGACPVGRAQWCPARRDATRAVQRHECSSGDERNEHDEAPWWQNFLVVARMCRYGCEDV